jgi:hypothetical protein
LNNSTRIIRGRPRILSTLITVLAATLLIAGPVLAFPPGPLTGNNSPFNALDALATCDPSPSPNLNNPTAGSAVTVKTCTESGGPGAVTIDWISDTLSGNATDNAWGQGDKSDCYLAKTGGVSGACVTQVFGIGAAKTDLQYHGIGLEKGTNGHDYLYSGIKRLQAGGVTSSNANYNVEVNQLLAAYKPADPVCQQTGSPTTGGCNLWRSPGDLTFMTDWGGNQSSCNVATPAICAYVWIDFSTGTGKTPSPTGSTCFNAQSAPCWGLLPGGNAALSANPNKAAGSINSGAATQPFTFSEIGIDLTESGLADPTQCLQFKNVWAHSRSSSSFSAELKDYIFGNVSLSTCTGTTTELHERTSAAGTTDVTPANNGLEITVAPGEFVNDVATVSPNTATGSIKFKHYTSAALCEADPDGSDTGTGITTVSTNTISTGSATSDTVTFSAAGDYYWRAFYVPGNLSASASPCNEIVHVVQVNTAISTSPWYYPNDSATLSAPNGGGTLTGTIEFKLFGATTSPVATAQANCTANTAQGLLYTQAAQPVSGVGPYLTNNTSAAVSTTGSVYWRVTFVSSNTNQIGRNSVCVENINATLTGDTGGSVGNTP